jgi:hypothetical protein
MVHAGVLRFSRERRRERRERLDDADKRRRRRRLEVAGELAGVEACSGNVRSHGEHGNQEAKQGEMRTRRCARVPGTRRRARFGRRLTDGARDNDFVRQRRRRIGEFPIDWVRLA